MEINEINFLRRAVAELSSEYSELMPGCVSIARNPPTAFEFLRNYVSPNVPVKIKNAINHWNALEMWSGKEGIEYLKNKLGDQVVSVAVTPDGYADAVQNNKFMYPEKRKMKFSYFLEKLKNMNTGEVFYIQEQNNNFFSEFEVLLGDIEDNISFANETFGEKPEAVNFWMGSSRSVTSLHKDNYENIYCVLRGSKDFILCPPVSTPFIPYSKYPAHTYEYHKGEWVKKNMFSEINWSPIDAWEPNFKNYPLFELATRYTCHLDPGDMLYLPSLWYHSVRQSDTTVAVNFWYNMQHDMKYCYFKFLEHIREKLYSNAE